MKFLGCGYFDETVKEEIIKLLDIDIEKPEYSDSCCSVEHISYKNNDLCSSAFKGVIGIIRDGFPLYWLKYSYTYDDDKCTDNCEISIAETFPENLELFGMKIKNPIHE